MKAKDGYFVYTYLDPGGGVVKYVGSGLYDRLYQHTNPSQLNRTDGTSPFRDWLNGFEGVEWRHHCDALKWRKEQEKLLKFWKNFKNQMRNRYG